LFYRELYRQMGSKFAKLHEAFKDAMASLWRKQVDGMTGTGVVLWSERSMLVGRTRRKRKPRIPAAESAASGAKEVSRAEIRQAHTLNEDEFPLLELMPLERINYCLLHNGRPLFDRFWLRRQTAAPVTGIQVHVELQFGTDTVAWDSLVNIDGKDGPDDNILDLTREISLPLTWSQALHFREDVRSLLRIRLTDGKNRVMIDRSYKVTLPPFAEWEDAKETSKWLPSFVFPQDTAVEQIISDARKYLAVLTRDINAGFDGYQRMDGRHRANRKPDYEPVLQQIEAVWHALLYERRLQYINPLPGTVCGRQRLRTPSQILSRGRGTCIDLALFAAACMEHIDIYPVVFLFNCHAFAGFWSSDEAHNRFVAMEGVDPASLEERRMPDVDPWCLSVRHYREVRRRIEMGDLVPLETTLLTGGKSVEEAIEAAVIRLNDASQFNWLIDIQHARKCAVTPLPFQGIET